MIMGILLFGVPIVFGLYMLWYNFINWNWGTYVWAWDESRFHKMRQCFGMNYRDENCFFDGKKTIWIYKRGIWCRAFEIENLDLLWRMRMWYYYGEDASTVLRMCGLWP